MCLCCRDGEKAPGRRREQEKDGKVILTPVDGVTPALFFGGDACVRPVRLDLCCSPGVAENVGPPGNKRVLVKQRRCLYLKGSNQTLVDFMGSAICVGFASTRSPSLFRDAACSARASCFCSHCWSHIMANLSVICATALQYCRDWCLERDGASHTTGQAPSL